MMINYISDFQSSAKQVVELEKVGLDMVWVAEAYSYDAISQIGYLAAVTNKIEIGTGIINVYSRTPALVAMTAAGCDYVSNGRFVLGLGHRAHKSLKASMACHTKSRCNAPRNTSTFVVKCGNAKSHCRIRVKLLRFRCLQDRELVLAKH